jgi:hypothetical protein
MFTFKVYNVALPDFEGGHVVMIDDLPAPFNVDVSAGQIFYVQMDEKRYEGQGFAWAEPTEPFKCLEVLNKNFGQLQAGTKIWMVQAKPEICQETYTLARPEWWTGEDKMVELNINVGYAACPEACAPGMMQASATSCNCVAVKIEQPEVDQVFAAHNFATGATIRVVMTVDTEVTLREFSSAGMFVYDIDTENVDLQCVIASAEPFKNEWYQQVTLQAKVPDCRWTYKLMGTEERFLNVEFIVMPLRKPDVPEGAELVLLDEFDWTTTTSHQVEMRGGQFVLVRVVEHQDGFTWERPEQEFQCLELVSDNLGEFKTGLQQWYF